MSKPADLEPVTDIGRIRRDAKKKPEIQLPYLFDVYPATSVPCGVRLHPVSKTLIIP